MHFSTLVVALSLPYAICSNRAADVSVGGATCLPDCYNLPCPAMGALFMRLTGEDARTAVEGAGCDCSACDFTDVLDLDSLDVPEDYACSATGYADEMSCDEMAYFGFSCHYMETRRGADCSGCLCEEAVLGFEKGDGSCPVTCVGATCDDKIPQYSFSCESMETLDWVMGCDCSGCDCDVADEDHPTYAYNGMDCNGNGYWGTNGVIGNEECDEEISSLTYVMGNPDDGFAEQTWFTCLNCPEMECDLGDCGDSCERGDTCALPLNELCADEDSVHTPTQFGRVQMCVEGWDATEAAATEAATEAATGAATEATVTAEDGVTRVATTAAFLSLSLLVLG